ncbi:hypothetical protein H6G51_05290 [Limnothrix sp. FACHB-708]|uniref:RiboL-PSP-HEPN domain-containing protein n=1 Tax=Limnothrix redekei LRLZ20PSL1 TaxID=3112953 RepID=A0ABW7C726_9CYAN|nr:MULTISPECIES: hypothetical protein [unclassified Limnothrix]MBD2552684.1 hypothetical protein [Limnothrix sp. FACHB-708]MBD2589954.1 hypothetical protein [Limnothrix sp. FACHB-406]
MRKSDQDLFLSFEKQQQTIDKTRKKFVSLAQQRIIDRKALHVAYEGLFLNAHIRFESLLEDLFLGLLVQGKSQGLRTSRSGIKPRLLIRSYAVARDIVSGSTSGKYIDWLPYERTQERAKIFFVRDGYPFTNLDKRDVDHLSQCNAIRNAIAHKSPQSTKTFHKKVIQSRSLPTSERTPAGFLAGVHSRRERIDITRYEFYITELRRIAQKLCCE